MPIVFLQKSLSDHLLKQIVGHHIKEYIITILERFNNRCFSGTGYSVQKNNATFFQIVTSFIPQELGISIFWIGVFPLPPG